MFGRPNVRGVSVIAWFSFLESRWPSNGTTERRGRPRASVRATSLRGELGVSIELKESTLLTTECSERQTLTTWRLRGRPERFFRLAFAPAHEKGLFGGILRHKSLDHFTVAFCTRHFVVGHRRLVTGQRMTALIGRRWNRALVANPAEDERVPLNSTRKRRFVCGEYPYSTATALPTSPVMNLQPRFGTCCDARRKSSSPNLPPPSDLFRFESGHYVHGEDACHRAGNERSLRA